MQSQVPDPADPTPSTREQENPSQSTIHQYPSSSSRPSRSPGAESSNAPGSSTGRRALRQPPRLRGSSRDTNEMQRSTTPPDASSSDAIKYTRTGRVSKATKGHRVHHCEECGKVCIISGQAKRSPILFIHGPKSWQPLGPSSSSEHRR